ncbi:response regulator transcription factor [Bradyrhizobium sp. 190]|uniref:response regulator transcription factor n=1 Tax=Bradyrhizobium sp. 190 TaxID=2782658 RepID=UPI0023EE753C|nr:LuxR C-terminal-related transcriptional regulator [Bradyrhizobium sp. 190]MCK1516278.1 response regulator transcription factor [Bradyrhizobium sp. 190]
MNHPATVADAMSVELGYREKQIARLLLRGKTNKEIAAALNLAEKTVKNYMSVLLDKLNVRNRLEALLAVQRLPQLHADDGSI